MTFTTLSFSTLVPTIATLVFRIPVFEQWPLIAPHKNSIFDCKVEIISLIATFILLGFYIHVLDTGIPVKLGTIAILGAVILGLGLGVFKRIAQAQFAASNNFLLAFIAVQSICAVTLGPAFMFPSVTNQVKDEVQALNKIVYYDDRAKHFGFFLLTGLLFAISSFALTKARAHYTFKESS